MKHSESVVPGNYSMCMKFHKVLFVFLLLMVSAAHANNSIKSISASTQSGQEIVRVETTYPLASIPEGFIVQSPARIAFDFPDTSSEVPRQAFESSKGNLRSANVVQAGNRTRLVLNLQQSVNYEAKIDGNALLVFLKPLPTGISASPASGGAKIVGSVQENIAPIRDIDFRKQGESTGRVMVSLPGDQVGVDIRQQGQTLVVEFSNTSLPEGLRRRLDVTDFGTPVQTVLANQVGNSVRLVVEPKGNWEHSAYQSDNQFVLEVRERKIDPSKLTQGSGYAGEKLSLNFQNIEIRALLQVIADFTNFNIVTSESVSGSVTLRLKDVPWDQALDIILQTKGLGMKKTDNVLWIAPKDELIAREKQELEARVNVESLEQLRTQVFQLRFAKAAEILPRLGGGAGAGSSAPAGQPQANSPTGLLSARGSASADPRTNQLFVTDIPTRLAEVQALIAKVDVSVQQVVIEARIVEANDSFGRTLGVRLGGADLRGVRGGDAGYGLGGGNRVAVGGSYDAVANSTGLMGGSEASTMSNFINLPARTLSAASEDSASRFAVTLFNPTANRLLNLEIQAMEAEGKGTVVSSPRLMTANQVKALIEQGTDIPYSVQTKDGPTLAFKKAVLKLEVTPQIAPDGQIILDLEINKDSVGERLQQGVAINTKAIKTQAIVENGGTVMLGGIFESTETKSELKVPLLGDLPVVGNLFRTRTSETDRKEMLVFITPRILSQGEIRN